MTLIFAGVGHKRYVMYLCIVGITKKYAIANEKTFKFSKSIRDFVVKLNVSIMIGKQTSTSGAEIKISKT